MFQSAALRTHIRTRLCICNKSARVYTRDNCAQNFLCRLARVRVIYIYVYTDTRGRNDVIGGNTFPALVSDTRGPNIHTRYCT